MIIHFLPFLSHFLSFLFLSSLGFLLSEHTSGVSPVIFYEGGLPLGAVAVQCFEEFEDGVKGASWCGNEEETINRKVLTRFSLDSHFFLQKYAKAGFVRATSMHRLQCSLRLTISAPDHLQSLITKPMQTSNHQTLPEGFFWSVDGADVLVWVGIKERFLQNTSLRLVTQTIFT